MNNEELKAKIEKEEKDLQALKEKKAKIESQIKTKTDKVNMSLSDLQRAIANKDLSAIQNKLKSNNSPNQ